MESTLEGMVRNTPPRATVLVEGIDPEARNARHFKGEIGFQELFIVPALFVVHDVVDEIMYLLVIHRRQVNTANIPIDTNHGWQTRRQVQVRCSLLGAERQKFCYIHRFPCMLPCAIGIPDQLKAGPRSARAAVLCPLGVIQIHPVRPG